jgi:predicted site-specific integrase-resolvase
MEKCVESYDTVALKTRWSCHENTIYNYVKQGLIPYFRTPGGRELRFPKDGIEEYEQNQILERKEVNKKTKQNRKVLSAPNKKWRAE